MWQAIGLVSSGVTLVAFIAAVAAWIYKRKLIAERDLIKAAPPRDRASLVRARLDSFEVDTSNLTKAQQHDVVIQQIERSARKYRTAAIVTVILAFFGGCLAAFAISKASEAVALRKDVKERDKRLAEIVAAREKLQHSLEEEQRRSQRLAGGVSVARDLATAAGERHPEILRLAEILKHLLKEFDTEFAANKLSESDALEVRLSKATLAIAEQRYKDALRLVTEDDIKSETEATEAQIVREVAALEVRGNALHGLREWQQALCPYERILQLRPSNVSAATGAASCLASLGRLNDALERFSELVDAHTRLVEQEGRSELNNDLGHFLNSRGLTRLFLNQSREAIEDLNKAIEIYSRLVDDDGRSDLANELAGWTDEMEGL